MFYGQGKNPFKALAHQARLQILCLPLKRSQNAITNHLLVIPGEQLAQTGESERNHQSLPKALVNPNSAILRYTYLYFRIHRCSLG